MLAHGRLDRSQACDTQAPKLSSETEWDQFLDHVSIACGARAAARAIHSVPQRSGWLRNTLNIPIDFVTSYPTYSERLHRALRISGHISGEPVAGCESLGQLSDFTDAWVRPQGLGPTLVGIVPSGEQLHLMLLLFRTPDDTPFGEREIGILRGALAAIPPMIRMERRAAAHRRRTKVLNDTIDRVAFPLLVVDPTAVLKACNRAGRMLVEQRNCLVLQHERLTCVTSRDAQKLRQALDQVFAGGANPPEAVSAAAILNRTDDSPLPLLLVRLGNRAPAPGCTPNAAIIACDPDAIGTPKSEWLKEWYGLSRVDAEIAAALVAGLTPDEIARKTRASVHTVRAHLKRVFLKTGTGRQSELIRLLMAGPTLFVDPRAVEAPAQEKPTNNGEN